MDIRLFDEPLLQFGYGEHIDVRYGISNYFAFDVEDRLAPKEIKLAVIGTNDTIEKVRAFLELCRKEIPAKKSRKSKLFPKFCGFNSERGFKSTFITDDGLMRTLPIFPQSIKPSITQICDAFIEEVRSLSDKRPDVIVCAPPAELVEILFETADDKVADEDEEEIFEKDNFRRMLKAKAITYRVPLQILLPHTYDEKVRYLTESLKSKQVQDIATRAWNLCTAIYYKAGGAPWRLKSDPSQYTTCYVGISFYEPLGAETRQTSLAQVFNERGKGVILRGGKATEQSKEDRQPHLSAEAANQLIDLALQRYRDEHGNLPARVVVHKTSNFTSAEIEGFESALNEKGIDLVDMLTIFKSDLRLYRNGLYPPLRGTKLDLHNDVSLLYTRGSVQFYETYPGLYIPRALEVRSFKRQQTMNWLSEEILALTKMNWNNTQFDGSLPITLKCARQVGDILKYLPEEAEVEHRYAFYM
jgi:hypothetical protein